MSLSLSPAQRPKILGMCYSQRASLYQEVFQSVFLMNYECSRLPDYAANIDTKDWKMASFLPK